MAGSASIRKKEITTAGIGAILTVCLFIASGTSISAQDIPRWFRQVLMAPFVDSNVPRSGFLTRQSSASLYSMVYDLRKAQTRKATDVARSNAFRLDSSSGIDLPVPGARFDGIRFNELGWRGPSLPKTGIDNTLVIVFLGSSITLDKNTIPDGRSWPGLVTRKLQRMFPECRIAYQNTGIPGLSSRRLGDFYSSKVLEKVRPDVVIVMTDDRKIRLRELAEEAQIPNRGPAPLTFSREQLLQQYREDLPALLGMIQRSDAVPVLLSFGQHLALYTRYSQPGSTLGSIGAARSLFVSREGLEQSARWYNAENRRTATDLGVPYIKWHEKLPGARHYLDQRHFKPSGSALMADILAEQLSQSSIFREALADKHPCTVASR